MAKTGRPKKDEGEQGTTQVRIFDEMHELIEDLRLVLPLSTAQILQRVGLTDLKELHDKYCKQIADVKKADRDREEVARKAREEAEKLEGANPPKPAPRKRGS